MDNGEPKLVVRLVLLTCFFILIFLIGTFLVTKCAKMDYNEMDFLILREAPPGTASGTPEGHTGTPSGSHLAVPSKL